jgi:ABC-type Fe3+-hydroxamate transport system substrate-binding protein
VRRRLLAAFVAFIGFSVLCCRREAPPPEKKAEGPRIVTLAPGITDTIFAIGAGSQVVARSDYCDYPPEVKRVPAVGTSLTPSYETISRLAPTLILGEANAATRTNELQAVGPTRLLPWLTLMDVIESTRELGRLTAHTKEANELANRMHDRLAVPPPESGPRVLLVIGYRPGKLDEIWFIRDNSLHGAALRAAGAKNAVPEAVSGLPRLSPERLITLDPDAIFVLALPGKAQPDQLDGFRKLTPLRAVEKNRLAVIEAPEAYVHGPRILALVDRLQGALKNLGLEAAP